MGRKTSIRVAAITLCVAFGIGFGMQSWQGSVEEQASDTPLDVSEVQEVTSAPRPVTPIPMDTQTQANLPNAVVSNEAEPVEPSPIVVPEPTETAGFDCEIEMTATPAAGAMMDVSVTAPCHGSERVTLHHNGLMFTTLMQPDGTLAVQVPALTENALVIASFMDGGGAVAQTRVTSVPFYDRIVLQWRGAAGLQLHAREFDAEYFGEGHIWQGADSDPTRAASGDGGFLTRLGSTDAPDALLAEVYTFPSGISENSGTVALTVEAEIIASNCDTSVEAQTLELRNGRDLSSKELTIDVPGCDAIGDFLLLKNIVEDLTIAAK